MDKEDEVIIGGTVSDVSADNYEEFDNELDPGKLGKRLVQKNSRTGSSRTFQFYSGQNLLLDLIEKKGAAEKKYQIDLAWISAEPLHNRIVIWKWLALAIISAISAGVFFYLGTVQSIPSEVGNIAATIALTLSVIFILSFIYCIRDEYIFRSCFGGANIFLMENKKPDIQTFDSFYLQLQQVIDKSHRELSISDRLIGEMKMCRRLRDEGIIDDASYTRARTAIFSHKEYRS